MLSVQIHVERCKTLRLNLSGMSVQMRVEKRRSDLAMFKDRAEALRKAVHILDAGIAFSRTQVSQTTVFAASH